MAARQAEELSVQVRRVLEYIQGHLDDPMTLNHLAAVAHVSEYHFHRLFKAATGETLNGHIRRLRLERAAKLLVFTTDAITDIGLDAGYETHSAFSRAFARWFEVSPTAYRQRRRQIFPQVPSFQPTWSEDMHVEIRELPVISVVSIRRIGPYAQAAAESWQKLMQWAGPRGLIGPDAQCFGVSWDDPQVTDADLLRYDACLAVDPEVEGDGEVKRRELAPGRYAVLTYQGPYSGLEEVYAWFYGTWLGQSGHRLRDEPCMEKYLNDPTNTPEEELLTEIFLPIE